MIYLRLARAQASGHDGLVCDNDPVSEPVHPVLELGMTLQVGLQLLDFVHQLMCHLQRKEGESNMSKSERRKCQTPNEDNGEDMTCCSWHSVVKHGQYFSITMFRV